MKHPTEVLDLVSEIAERRPNGSVSIGEPTDENGEWLLDIFHRDDRMTISWQDGIGYTERDQGDGSVLHHDLESIVRAMEARIASAQSMTP